MIKQLLLSLCFLIAITFSSAFASEFVSINGYKDNDTKEQQYIINIDDIKTIYMRKTTEKNPYEIVLQTNNTFVVKFFMEMDRKKFLEALKKQIVIKEVK